MTTFTEPLIVASAGTQGDATSVFKVSGNDMTLDGDFAGGGHVLAASAVTLNVDTTAAAVAGAGAGAGAVPASAAFAKLTVNGTEFKIALYS